MNPPTITLLRGGEIYRSLDTQTVTAVGTDDAVAMVTFANSGLVRKDLLDLSAGREALSKFSTAALMKMIQQAGDYFLNDALPVGEAGELQTPDDYVHSLSATSGLPHALIRMNMKRLHAVFQEVPTIFAGLTRGLDPAVLDAGFGEQNGVMVSFTPTTDALGVILPSNSPAVNALWIPAIAMKTPVVLKPGREEPWTPWRVIQACLKAGVPAQAFNFYPCDHDGSNAIIRRCGRVMLFGDDATVAKHANDPRIEVHGSGRSKIIFGEDTIDDWRDHLDILVHSISANSGRSCINASAILVPRHADEIAQALAERLVDMVPRDADDSEANLSGFANPKMTEWINGAIEDGLSEAGAEDVSARLRGSSERAVSHAGMNYLLPTIVRCAWDHPLANKEFLFPYASVVEMPQAEMVAEMGKSLVVSAITTDKQWLAKLLASPDIERLNVGAMATNTVHWDQPHEGNLFEFLFQRRSIQIA